jgi:hypothetical protein
MVKKYEGYLKVDKEYQPVPGVSIHKTLDPGVYRVDWDMRNDAVTFVAMENNHDQLVDLPGTEYDSVMKDMDMFLSAECMSRFDSFGFLQKMNILLYGSPGTGKTCIVSRVSQKIIASGGIVLFNPQPASLKTTYDVLDSVQPDTRVLVIFEEMDEHVKNDETGLLHVLDGEVQKKNAMYIATTNYIERIPARIRRPGRFASVIEVGFPSLNARKAYLATKISDKDAIESIAKKTEGFTIDELREVLRGHYCMMKPLDQYIQLIKDSSSRFIGVGRKDDDNEYDLDSWVQDHENASSTIKTLKKLLRKKASP